MSDIDVQKLPYLSIIFKGSSSPSHRFNITKHGTDSSGAFYFTSEDEPLATTYLSFADVRSITVHQPEPQEGQGAV